jgi:HlyD family secretion protein
MKLKWWLAIAVVIIAIGSVFGWPHLRGAKASQYQTASIVVGDIHSSVAATGTCNAVVTVQVGSQVSGNIKALYADFNTKVTKGQLVAAIDPEPFQARVNQARANVDSARAAVLNAKAGVARAEADVASAIAARENVNAQLARAQADLRDADVKLKRRLKLFEQSLISKEDTDTAQATYDANAATVKAVEAQIKSADQNIKAAEAQRDVSMAQTESTAAQVRQTEAALAQAELDLRHAEIRAPVDGTVIARHMDVGQTVAASFQAPTIFDIAQDLTKMQVDTNVDESDISQVQVGQHASFTVDAYPSITFPADVYQIRKNAINVQNVITYDVVLRVDNSAVRLLPGMTANVRILTNTAKDTLKVPNAALRFRPAGTTTAGRRERGTQTVYVLDSGGTPRPLQVSTSLSDGNFTGISSNELHEGDLVIVGSSVQGASTQAVANRAAGPRGPGF